MVGIAGVNLGIAQTESRSIIIVTRLAELEQRMEALTARADKACIQMTGMSACPPMAPSGSDVAQPSMGLYSDIFASLERLNTFISMIEQSVEEIAR